MIVAIASENDDYDGEIYRTLLQQLLGRGVQKWQTDMRFNGDKSVWKQAAPYLQRALQQGVRHALLAVDNDGSSTRRQEHSEAHQGAGELADPDGCRVCWLRSALPTFWSTAAHPHCIVVPVQCIETWLLAVRGDEMAPSPERAFSYSRPDLKRRFFGSGTKPPLSTRLKLALEQLSRPEATGRLRERASFRHFEAQLRSWPLSGSRE